MLFKELLARSVRVCYLPYLIKLWPQRLPPLVLKHVESRNRRRDCFREKHDLTLTILFTISHKSVIFWKNNYPAYLILHRQSPEFAFVHRSASHHAFAQPFTSDCDLFLCEEGYHPLPGFSKQDVSSGDAATQPLEPSRRITAEEDLSKYPAAVPRISSGIQIYQATTRNWPPPMFRCSLTIKPQK